MAASAPTGGFSLFPNTSARPPSRNLSRPRGQSPQPLTQQPQQEERASSRARTRSPSQNGRRTPLQQQQQQREQQQSSAANGRQAGTDGRVSAQGSRVGEAVVEPPAPVADPPTRCGTAFSEANTLVRNGSTRSRSSIAKPPISASPVVGPNATAEPAAPAPALRSIFPQYNPDLPADRQEYYPTQTSPQHIPRAAISRALYSPVESQQQPQQQQPARNTMMRSPVASPTRSRAAVRSPVSPAQSTTRWPPRQHEAPKDPETSTTEELRGLWKVANGWKAGASEGRVFCLRMMAEKDCPSYTLSSSTQPLYSLRIDPTSASAHISLARHDPSRPCKGPSPAQAANSASSASSTSTSAAAAGGAVDTKNWQEVLATTLEEDARRFTPDDGLVALLYPAQAARVAAERPDDGHVVDMAERECARLVWDADSRNYYLVHPALALPFCVTVDRSPAWSRTEYTLEHLESPQHLARLTRDGTGAGWLEVDTAIAAKIDAVYLVDVAVAALMLVAHKDNEATATEFFEPPPSIFAGPPGSGSDEAGGRSSRQERRLSRMSKASKASRRDEHQQRRNAPRKMTRMEEFELDIESQTSELNKSDVKDRDKLPASARGVIKILTVTFKCFIWMLTLGFKALTGCIALLAKCLTSDKL